MNLDSQVCSLELAKKLKDLGVKQESLFCFRRWIAPQGSSYVAGEWRISLFKSSVRDYEFISAFTVGELGEMLPEWFDSCKRAEKDWTCRVMEKHSDKNYHAFSYNEANARAEMLIYLIEKGLITYE